MLKSITKRCKKKQKKIVSTSILKACSDSAERLFQYFTPLNGISGHLDKEVASKYRGDGNVGTTVCFFIINFSVPKAFRFQWNRPHSFYFGITFLLSRAKTLIVQGISFKKWIC